MNSKKMLVSICCLTYNHQFFIEDCLNGFLMQKTNFQFEILIHDDSSTDKTQDIIRKYHKKFPEILKPILQVENKHSQGIRPTFEYNLPRAKGKYIAMCEGDDYWTDPYKLQKQVDFLEANPDYILTHHKYINVDMNGDMIKEMKTPLPCTILFRNELDNMPDMKDCPNGDRFLFTYFSLKGKFKYLDDIKHSVRRYHPGGVMSMVNQEIKLARQAKTWTVVYDAFKDTRLEKELFYKRNIFVYRNMLLRWKLGDEKIVNLVKYPFAVKHYILYRLLLKCLFLSKEV